MKRSGSIVFLMELIVVILFFSLSAVVTLQLFVAAHHNGRKSAIISDALNRAQSVAEKFQAEGSSSFSGNGWEAGDKNINSAGNERWFRFMYQTEGGEDVEIFVRIETESTDFGQLEQGDVRVSFLSDSSDSDDSKNQLCTLEIARYTPNAEVAS